MGTHPIFESDFDCLTEWANTVTQYLSVILDDEYEVTIFEIRLKNLVEFWT